MDINEATAKAISAERAIAKITVRDLSQRSGIPMSSLMRVLQAEREIKVNQIALLAAAFEIYPHEIIEHAERILERDRLSAGVGEVSSPGVAPIDDLAAKRAERRTTLDRKASPRAARKGVKKSETLDPKDQ